MSVMKNKITGLVVVLLSCITINGAQASKDMERVPSRVTIDSGYLAGNSYKPESPFSVDRAKKNIGVSDVNDRIIESKSLVLQKDGLLSKQLEKWVNHSGYTLLWNSNRDYIIYNTIILNADSFDDVLKELGKLFDSDNYGLVIKQYEVNKVIIIDAQ